MDIDWVPLAVAFASGHALPKLLDVFNEWRKDRRHSKPNYEDRAERAERRARIAVEWGHENRVAAIRAGVPSKDLPVLDFKE